MSTLSRKDRAGRSHKRSVWLVALLVAASALTAMSDRSAWADTHGQVHTEQSDPPAPPERAEEGELPGSACRPPTGDVTTPEDITGHWAEEQITAAITRGIWPFPGDQPFGPNDQITRLDYAVLMARTLCIDPVPSDWLTIADRHLFTTQEAGYVAAMVANQIIAGYPDNTFRPANRILRQEMALLLDRALRERMITIQPAPQLPFADRDSIPNWAVQPVARMLSSGLMRGNDNGSFAPASLTSRAEAATILDRLLTLLTDRHLHVLEGSR